MPINSLLWEHRGNLIRSFHFASIHGILNTWQRCTGLHTIPQEPDFVAGIIYDSLPVIHNALRAVLNPRGFSISVCGVFCHQKPEVTLNDQEPGCELGDILFAYVHRSRAGSAIRNAILFQAKLASRLPYQINAQGLQQLRLYMSWPDFDYVRSPPLTGRRSVTPKAPHPGAQYLLIDGRSLCEPESGLLCFPGRYPVGCCMPAATLYSHSDLASELFNMLIFRTGRGFEDRTAALTGQDWSRVVWDLLESGMSKIFNRRNSGRYRQSRLTGDAIEALDGISFCQASSSISYSTVTDLLGSTRAQRIFTSDDQGDNPPHNRERQGDENEGERGISVILIETSEREPE